MKRTAMTTDTNGTRPRTATTQAARRVPKVPSLALRRALEARLEALLRAHLPADIYPAWREKMALVPQAPGPEEWAPALVWLAASAPLMRRGRDVPESADTDTPEGRTVARNTALLSRLLIRGIRHRGEGQEAA